MATLTTQSGLSDIATVIRTVSRARSFYRAARAACVASGYITAEAMDAFGAQRENRTWQEWVLFALSQLQVAYGKKWVNRGTTDEEHAAGYFELAGPLDMHTDCRPADAVIAAILAKLPF